MHTPGPWTIDGPNKDGSWEVRNEELVICSRNPVHHLANQSCENALLVAAAPDLLAGAQAVTAVCDSVWLRLSDGEAKALQDAFRILDAAIAKAIPKKK